MRRTQIQLDEQTYRILRDAAGFQLDPGLVERFIAAHSRRRDRSTG